MSLKSKSSRFFILSGFALLLSGCGSDTEDSGFVNFYNASANSPEIYLTLDEDLDSDDDDEIEKTYRPVGYANTLKNKSVPSQDYFYELAWQDDDDSSWRDDLQIIFEDRLSVRDDEITFVIMSGDLPNQDTTVFNIPIIDDDDDHDDDLFNLRFLNVVGGNTPLDIYISEHDETFHEAEFVTTLNYHELTENFKFEEDRYIFYITEPGKDDVIFESEEISYPYTNQYVLSVRPNIGAGTSPFVLDNIGNTRVDEYKAIDAEAKVRFYNGIQENDLLGSYTGSIKVYSDISEESESLISNLARGQFSESFMVREGSYRVDIKDEENDEAFIVSQLIDLPKNSDRTIFYYLIEEWVDDDEDGDFDEDDDGQVDEIEAEIRKVIVENSTRERINEHEIKMLNLAYSEDFSHVTFYFVKNDEIIESAGTSRTIGIGNSKDTVLLNNTYDVYAIALIDGSEIILDSMLLTLDENSRESYMLLETDIYSPTGFKISLHDQLATK
ncbi:MAG: hypothetical protein ACQEVQ_06655 [Pseudomonadota bacterium]